MTPPLAAPHSIQHHGFHRRCSGCVRGALCGPGGPPEAGVRPQGGGASNRKGECLDSRSHRASRAAIPLLTCETCVLPCRGLWRLPPHMWRCPGRPKALSLRVSMALIWVCWRWPLVRSESWVHALRAPEHHLPPALACCPAAPAQLPQLITQETLRSLEVRTTRGVGDGGWAWVAAAAAAERRCANATHDPTAC